ncbi:hypothetical protein [Methylobacterium amylolyticum]|uniref:hypothetical protein n=1 Tax=Methylobacterium sp. NEAU 140 TaxID=3064945 RepID=UPI0027370BDE|nr:hypothetical protein [Methylobacterium sp. NEAU 140]
MRVVVVTPPTALVSAAEAKAWAPVLKDDDDARVNALLLAAQAAIEPPNGWLGRALGMQVLEARFDAFRGPCLFLPCPPLREVVSVTYSDGAGVDQIIAPAALRVMGVGTSTGSISPRGSTGWPATDFGPEAVRVRFKAGYAVDDMEVVQVRHAIVLAATHLRSLSTQDLNLRSRQTEGVGSRTWTVSDAAEKLIHRAVDDLLSPLRVLT